MGALLACFATLYSGMLFYIGYETDRIPEWSLDFASFVIIAGNSSFMLYCLIYFVVAMRREAKEAKGMTAAERRLYLRNKSKEKSKLMQLNLAGGRGGGSGGSGGNRPKILGKMRSMARLAVHHEKGVKNFELHDKTKEALDDKLKQKRFQSKARLAKRIRIQNQKNIRNRTTVVPKPVVASVKVDGKVDVKANGKVDVKDNVKNHGKANGKANRKVDVKDNIKDNVKDTTKKNAKKNVKAILKRSATEKNTIELAIPAARQEKKQKPTAVKKEMLKLQLKEKIQKKIPKQQQTGEVTTFFPVKQENQNKGEKKSKTLDAAMQRKKSGGVESSSSDMIKMKLRKMGRAKMEVIATKLQKKSGWLSRKNLAVMFKKLGMKEQDDIEDCLAQMATVSSNKISPKQFCNWVFGGTHVPKEPTFTKKQTETVMKTHKVDPATGKHYSVDKDTGQSTWVVQNRGDEQLVNHIETIEKEGKALATREIHTDPATGKRYSIDKNTGESRWVVE
jgi:hypothetical protein